MSKAWMHWSGGKDSAYTLWKASQDNTLDIQGLITNLSTEFSRVSMHGVREELLDAQAKALGLPCEKLFLPEGCTMEDYDRLVIEKLNRLKDKGGEVNIFGDIFLEDLKEYRENLIHQTGMRSAYPIWKECDTYELAHRIIKAGIKAVIVCVSGKFFDPGFLGREYDESFIRDLPEGVDPCGENGEFHTFVYDSPMYKSPINFKLEETVDKTYETNSEDEDCDCCQTWDTQFHFQELTLK